MPNQVGEEAANRELKAMGLVGLRLEIFLSPFDVSERLRLLPVGDLLVLPNLTSELGFQLGNLLVQPVDRLDVLADVAVDIEDVPCDNLGLDPCGSLCIDEGIVGIVEVL